MELRQLKYFEKACEQQNFSEAARLLYISQSTLSQQIKQLEEELDVLLFDRIGKRVVPTEAGNAFLPYARKAIQDAESGRQIIRDLKGIETGTLLIGATYSLSGLLTDALAEFTRTYPKIKVEITFATSHELLEALAGGQMDCVLSFRPEGCCGTFETLPLFSSGLYFIVHRSHPLAGVSSMTLKRLSQTPLILPAQGFAVEDPGYQAPAEDGSTVTVAIAPDSQRLQRLEPFAAWNGNDYQDLRLLIKTQGKCTTDHISAAGPWLRFRGHLENISDNLLMGATNAFNDGAANSVLNPLTGSYDKVSAVAKAYKAAGLGSIVVAQENYGEGSSREHAAMEPRFLNVKVVLAQSFARIHETNLKKQGMLALTFAHKDDWNKVREDDTISILGLKEFAPGRPLTVALHHADGTSETFEANHTYNALQIEWFKAGSALNLISKNTK